MHYILVVVHRANIIKHTPQYVFLIGCFQKLKGPIYFKCIKYIVNRDNIIKLGQYMFDILECTTNRVDLVIGLSKHAVERPLSHNPVCTHKCRYNPVMPRV